MTTKTQTNLTAVRKILKAAGLEAAQKQASTMVRGYTTVTRQGFALSNETVYERKQHVKTGRVVVDFLLSSWHGDEEQAHRDMMTAAAALTEAGYEAGTGNAPRQLVVEVAA
jgi:hypothetical protein